MPGETSVVLHWLPLGAGGTIVRFSGKAFEAISARRQGREPAPLFHAALEITLDGRTSVIEIAPAVNSLPASHGVVGTGPVGARWAGRWKAFRYELRCWEGGSIPDLAFERSGPLRLSTSESVSAAILENTSRVPMLTWGRDERGFGDMWNSNSVISWLLLESGVDLEKVAPPDRGRAPGWEAGIEAVRRG